MSIRRWLLVLFLGAACLPLIFAAPADVAKLLAGFDTEVEAARVDWEVPGIAVGIIQEGQIVHAKGYGHRAINSKQPVTPRSVFAVGSVTKSFTAAVLATLVDEGKLEWDRPVREYLAWFRLFDPVATELITPRDLLCHRSGLPRHDFIRFAVPLARKDLVYRLRYLEPSKSFRSTYQYQNLMYVTAGFLAGELAGSSWEQLVRQRIFQPLGMTGSTVAVSDSRQLPDFALPHERREGNITPEDFYDYQRFGVGPNGAVNSSVDDMLKYLQFHIEGRTAGGREIISRAQMREMHSPQMTMGLSGEYGLGWIVGTRVGKRFIHHGGSITGFQAWAGFLPQEKLGVVVLTNLNPNPLPAAIGLAAVDRMLGGKAQSLPKRSRLQTQPTESRRREPKPGTHPSHLLTDFTGDYSHPAYGPVQVEVKTGQQQLSIVFPAATLELKHFHYDTFQRSDGSLVQFHMNEDGEIERFSITLESAVKPLVFVRVAKR
jgi:CubicO group peptidase (beta-lactamase class C family)